MEKNMEITINKTELAGALAALGKLVSRTSLRKAYQGIEIEGLGNILSFRTCNGVEQIEFRMTVDLGEDFPATLVEFEQFRQTVRNSKKKMLDLKVEKGEIFIDGVILTPINGHFQPKEKPENEDVSVIELPADTLASLSLLAPIADKVAIDKRKAIGGINLSSDGFTATNGKELLNIPIPLKMTGSVTIPFPLALLATKAFNETGQLTIWQKDDDTHFELMLGSWTWRAQMIKEHYPNWRCVVPERTEKTHYVSFGQDKAEQLIRFLKSVPDDPKNYNGIKLSHLPETPDTLLLESSNKMLCCIQANFDPNWGGLTFILRKDFLLHLMEAGHRKIEINDSFGPIVGTGGKGMYITLPIYISKPRSGNEQMPEQTASSQTATPNAVQPETSTPLPSTESTESGTEQIPPHPQDNPAIPNTTSNKEKPIMSENTTITHVVSAPMQTSTQNYETEKELNPLDELLANIEDMKAKIKVMFDDSAAMVRKVREVALAQRQKEREYLQTKRTIERIRTASGF